MSSISYGCPPGIPGPMGPMGSAFVDSYIFTGSPTVNFIGPYLDFSMLNPDTSGFTQNTTNITYDGEPGWFMATYMVNAWGQTNFSLVLTINDSPIDVSRATPSANEAVIVDPIRIYLETGDRISIYNTAGINPIPINDPNSFHHSLLIFKTS